MRNSLLLTVAAASLLAGATAATAGTWVPANPPSGATSFTMFGITKTDVITGSYIDSSGNDVGFVGPFSGSSYTTFTDGGTSTEPRGINIKGDTTGYDVSTLIPWERTAGGTLTNVTMNGSDLNQLAQGINRHGLFVGDYTNSSSAYVGYVGKNAAWKKNIKLKIANSGYAGRAIDDAGDIGGWYIDPTTGYQRGFVKMGTKTILVDYPGTSTLYTVIEGLNNKGIVSGQWEDTSGVIHGFVYNIAKNKYTRLDVSGATFTQVWGINDLDVVAASADVSNAIGSYAYCMHTRGCPAPAKHVAKLQPNRSGKAPLPERN